MSEADSLANLVARVAKVEKKLLALTKELQGINCTLATLQNANDKNDASSSSAVALGIKRFLSDDSIDFERIKVAKKDYSFEVDDEGYTVVYTDGACENNGQVTAKAGLGVWFGRDHPLNLSKPVQGKATNNVGEIQACTAAINTAKSHGITKLHIHTDSQFVIKSITEWIKNWKRNGWKLASGGPVKNKKDFIKLDEAKASMDVKFTYVRGHDGIMGNECADRLAREGAAEYVYQH